MTAIEKINIVSKKEREKNGIPVDNQILSGWLKMGFHID